MLRGLRGWVMRGATGHVWGVQGGHRGLELHNHIQFMGMPQGQCAWVKGCHSGSAVVRQGCDSAGDERLGGWRIAMRWL